VTHPRAACKRGTTGCALAMCGGIGGIGRMEGFWGGTGGRRWKVEWGSVRGRECDREIRRIRKWEIFFFDATKCNIPQQRFWEACSRDGRDVPADVPELSRPRPGGIPGLYRGHPGVVPWLSCSNPALSSFSILFSFASFLSFGFRSPRRFLGNGPLGEAPSGTGEAPVLPNFLPNFDRIWGSDFVTLECDFIKRESDFSNLFVSSNLRF
jgi:hypothetical protein